MINNSAVRLLPFFINFKRPSDHSKFSPSSADRWLETGCSFSVNFAEHIESESSKYSIEGTFAHALCEAVFRQQYYGMAIPQQLLIDIQMWMAQDLSERSGALAEMFRCAHEYVEVVGHWLNDTETIGNVIYFGLEVPTPIFPDKSCFGTSDCIIVGTKSSVVIDFKYGKGKNVKADTVQLKVYAAGLIRFMEGINPEYVIHIVIHQPRTDIAPKYHSYVASELYQFLGVIWNSILKSEQKDLQPVEGNHCFWCPARRTSNLDQKCPAILQKPLKLAQERFAEFLHDMNAPVETITAANPKRDAALLKLHSLYPMIKQIVEDSTEEIKMRLSGGEAVNGFYLKDDFGNRMINGKDDKEKALLIQSKFPQVNPWKVIPADQKLKTLSEIEKEIGKNKLDPICVKKITKKVEIVTDKMQAVLGDLTSYAQMINNGEGQEN